MRQLKAHFIIAEGHMLDIIIDVLVAVLHVPRSG